MQDAKDYLQRVVYFGCLVWTSSKQYFEIHRRQTLHLTSPPATCICLNDWFYRLHLFNHNIHLRRLYDLGCLACASTLRQYLDSHCGRTSHLTSLPATYIFLDCWSSQIHLFNYNISSSPQRGLYQGNCAKVDSSTTDFIQGVPQLMVIHLPE